MIDRSKPTRCCWARATILGFAMALVAVRGFAVGRPIVAAQRVPTSSLLWPTIFKAGSIEDEENTVF